jgi:hypothetical protein
MAKYTDNICRLSLSLSSLIVLTRPTNPTTHTPGGIETGSDKQQFSETIKALYYLMFVQGNTVHCFSSCAHFIAQASKSSLSPIFLTCSSLPRATATPRHATQGTLRAAHQTCTVLTYSPTHLQTICVYCDKSFTG